MAKKTRDNRAFQSIVTSSADQTIEMSRARRAAGDLPAAERLLRSLLAVVPEHPAALHDLGALMVEREGWTADALDLFRRAVARDPNVATYQRNLGVALMHLGRLMEAEGHLWRALTLDPYSADGQFNIGSLLARQQRPFEAEKAFRAAVSLAPENPVYLYSLGRVRALLRKTSEAENAYRRALEKRPDYFDAMVSLVNLLSQIGRNDEAEELARELRQIASPGQLVAALARYTRCHAFRPDDPDIELLQSLLAQTTSQRDRGVLLAALGKAHDDIADYPSAFAYFRAAKEEHAKLTGQTYDRSRWDSLVARISHSFPVPAVITALDETAGATAIFIAGLSRSGKSLTESLLANHPGVLAAGETRYWEAAIKVVRDKYGVTEPFPDDLTALGPERIREIGEVYLESTRAVVSEARFIVETNPRNLLYVGLIFSALPGARVILCEREPMDHCLQMYFKQYRGAHPHTYDLADLGHYYLGYQKLVSHWTALYDDQLLRVRYEDLIEDPAGVASRVREYCGLHDAAGTIPAWLTPDEIGGWRHYERFLAPLMDALGAPREGASSR